MTRIYEVRSMNILEDFESEAEARAFVERRGVGHVTTFIRDFDGRERSCALNVYENGVWRGVDISR